MPDISNLVQRLDAEFSTVAEEVKKSRVEYAKEQQERQQRLNQLGKVFNELSNIWRPRLELLANKFGDRVKVSPKIEPSTRAATFAFQSSHGRVRLTFSASTDRNIEKVTLSYDLEIIPVLMRFTPHAEVEFPLSRVDADSVAKWIDDRCVDFVRTYLSLGDTSWYLEGQMVEDPIAHIRFPKQAAGATLQWQGQEFYFIDDETRREFERQKGSGSK